jgi:hypothetical protein
MKINLAFILSILMGSHSFACNCEGFESVHEAYHASDVVFSGEVVRMTFVATSESMNPNVLDSLRRTGESESRERELLDAEFLIKVELKINRCFKGNSLQDTVTIYTTRTGASCGYRSFMVGSNYIVYATRTSYLFDMLFRIPAEISSREGTYWTNQCMRTQEYTYAETVELEKCMKND